MWNVYTLLLFSDEYLFWLFVSLITATLRTLRVWVQVHASGSSICYLHLFIHFHPSILMPLWVHRNAGFRKWEDWCAILREVVGRLDLSAEVVENWVLWCVFVSLPNFLTHCASLIAMRSTVAQDLGSTSLSVDSAKMIAWPRRSTTIEMGS